MSTERKESIKFVSLELLDGKAMMYLSDDTMVILTAKEVATFRPERVSSDKDWEG